MRTDIPSCYLVMCRAVYGNFTCSLCTANSGYKYIHLKNASKIFNTYAAFYFYGKETIFTAILYNELWSLSYHDIFYRLNWCFGAIRSFARSLTGYAN